MINTVILIAVGGSGIDVVVETTGRAARGPDDKLGRGVVSNGARRLAQLGGSQVGGVAIPATVERVVRNAVGGGHDLRADLNRHVLNAEAVEHHTSVENATSGSSYDGVRNSSITLPSHYTGRGEKPNNTLAARRRGKKLVNVRREGHSTSLGVVHLSPASRGGVVPAIGATIGPAIGATAVEA